MAFQPDRIGFNLRQRSLICDRSGQSPDSVNRKVYKLFSSILYLPISQLTGLLVNELFLFVFYLSFFSPTDFVSSFQVSY